MLWWQLLGIGALSLAVAALLVVTQRWHGRWTGDFEGAGVQKHHTGSPPRVGGLALLAGILTSLVVIGTAASAEAGTSFKYLLLICLASVPVVTMGLADDLTKKIRPRLRLLGALISAVLGVLLFSNLVPRINIPAFEFLLEFKLLAVAVTLLMVGGFVNAMNIVDGLNGLASGLALLMLAATGAVAVGTHDGVIAMLCMALAAVIGGFALVNFPRGLIFLGDGGAYFIGFALVQIWMLLLTRNTELSTWFVVAIAAHPTMETVFSMYRRRLHRGRGGAFSVADRLHLHTLVYRRRTRGLVPAGQWQRPWAPNALASLRVLAFASMPMLAASLAPANSVWCAGVFAAYVVAYLLWFRHLVWFGRVLRRTSITADVSLVGSANV